MSGPLQRAGASVQLDQTVVDEAGSECVVFVPNNGVAQFDDETSGLVENPDVRWPRMRPDIGWSLDAAEFSLFICLRIRLQMIEQRGCDAVASCGQLSWETVHQRQRSRIWACPVAGKVQGNGVAFEFDRAMP